MTVKYPFRVTSNDLQFFVFVIRNFDFYSSSLRGGSLFEWWLEDERCLCVSGGL